MVYYAYQWLFDMEDTTMINQFLDYHLQLSTLKPTIDLHVVQYLELTEAMGDKVEIQSNNSPSFPTNKIHILIYD